MLLIILIFIIIFISIFSHYSIENYLNYNKCKSISKKNILNDVFKKLDIHYSDHSWDIYIPCNYTFQEQELINLNIENESQKVFGITGSNILAGKDNLWYRFEKKYGRSESRKYLPDTYILKNPDHMDLFSKNFKKNKVYYLKKNIQQKKGIKLVKDLDNIYNNFHKGYVIVQESIENLYTINKRKINLRLYVLITCQNHKINWYLSTKGKCLYTNKNIDEKNILDPESHLTSLNLDYSIYKYNPLTLDDLENYIGKSNYKYLFNNIITILKKCRDVFNIGICKKNTRKKNIFFQLFGVDFIFNKSFQPYLLEFNKGPQMNFFSEKEKQLKSNVFLDLFEKIGIKTTHSREYNSFIDI